MVILLFGFMIFKLRGLFVILYIVGLSEGCIGIFKNVVLVLDLVRILF